MKNQCKKVPFLGMVMLLWVVSLFAQGPDALWIKTYGESGYDDEGYSLQQTFDGGYVIAGWTSDRGGDVYFMKASSAGMRLWAHAFGWSAYDQAYSVCQTADSGFIIAGYTNSVGAGLDDLLLMRTNANGGGLWSKTHGGTLNDRAYSVQQTSDGGYIITGYADYKIELGLPTGSLWLIKTDLLGNIEWDKKYGGMLADKGYSAQQTTDGGYIVTGYHAQTWNLWLIKTNSSGDISWSKTFGMGGDCGKSVQQTRDGGYIVAGYTQSYSCTPGTSDVWLLKTDENGDSLWAQVFGGPDWDEGYSVWQTFDGGYLITGHTRSYSCTPGTSDVWLIRTDSLGNRVWDMTFGGNGFDYGRAAQETPDGGYIIAGYSNSYGASNYEILLIKLRPIKLVSPNGGESFLGGSLHTVEWWCGKPETLDHYRLLYSTNAFGWGTMPYSLASPHPYPSNYDTIWIIDHPGASKMKIHFDTLETDPSLDFVYIYDENDNQITSYDGMQGDFWTPEIPGDTVKIRLVTDANIQKYGFDVDRYATYYIVEQYKDTIADMISRDSTSYGWTLPEGNFPNCRVKIDMLDSFNNIISLDKSDSTFAITRVGVEEGKRAMLKAFSLYQNYPNPFTSSTVIKFHLSVDSKVSLKIYDLMGRPIRTLVQAKKETGYYTTYWDGKNDARIPVTNGIYFYKIQTGNYTETRKMLLLK